MAFVPAPNIAMTEMRAVCDGQHIENRVMTDCLHTPTAADLDALNAIWAAWLTSNYRFYCHPGVAWTEVVSTDIGSLTGLQRTEPVSAVGQATGGPLPNETSVCASLRTGSRGRSARGRFYLLPIGQQYYDPPNQFTAALATNVIAALITVFGSVTGAGFIPVIVSFRSENAPRPGGPVYFPITTVTFVDRVLDSQRRRKPGVGA